MSVLIERYIDLSKVPLIADVGCGPGTNTGFFRQYGIVTAFDGDDYAMSFIKKQWNDQIPVKKWVYPEPLDKKYGLIIMNDVREHLRDDSGIIEWLKDNLAEGGYALITVPSNKWLWSEMDDVMGHYRRYNRKAVQKMVHGELEIIRLSYYNFLMFPAKIIFVLFSRLKQLVFPKNTKKTYNEVPSAPLSFMFKIITSIETALIEYTNLPFGAGLVGLFRKK